MTRRSKQRIDSILRPARCDSLQEIVRVLCLQDGWGIATDGASLIVSDSGPTLYWLDGKTLKEIRRVDVHDGTRKVPWVNEVRNAAGYHPDLVHHA